MSTMVRYVQGTELPSLALTWRDDDANLIDFTAGWTFSLRIGASPVVEKTAGITGAADDPNVTIDWAAGELDGIVPGQYAAQLWARRTADSLDRVLPFNLAVLPAIVPA